MVAKFFPVWDAGGKAAIICLCIRAENCENCEGQMVLPFLPLRVSLKERFGVFAGSRVTTIMIGREIKMSHSLVSILSRDKALL